MRHNPYKIRTLGCPRKEVRGEQIQYLRYKVRFQPKSSKNDDVFITTLDPRRKYFIPHEKVPESYSSESLAISRPI